MTFHRSAAYLFRTSSVFSNLAQTASSPGPSLLIGNTIKRRMASAMGKRLEGKTIVITGASSGIGKSTALEFARTSSKSLKLVLTARRLDSLKQLASAINEEVGDGVKVLPVQLDVSKPDQVRNFVQNLPKEYQDIDVLVNNAGLVKGMDKAGEIKEEDIQVMMDTNVNGLIHMTQAVLKVMRKRGENGQGDIINIGSIAGREGYPGGSIYCATKAAIRTFTEAIRKELIATRIRVMEIDPGQVETEFSLVRFSGDKAKADKVYEGVTPLTPEDIAETIVFVAGRPENVVVADMLIFPNHQVSIFCHFSLFTKALMIVEGVCNYYAPKDSIEGFDLTFYRLQLRSCTESQTLRPRKYKIGIKLSFDSRTKFPYINSCKSWYPLILEIRPVLWSFHREGSSNNFPLVFRLSKSS